MQKGNSRWSSWAVIVTLVGLLTGCATPVGVSRVDSQDANRLRNESALATGKLSEPTKKLLRRQDLLDTFDAQPAQARGSHGNRDRIIGAVGIRTFHINRIVIENAEDGTAGGRHAERDRCLRQ